MKYLIHTSKANIEMELTATTKSLLLRKYNHIAIKNVTDKARQGFHQIDIILRTADEGISGDVN